MVNCIHNKQMAVIVRYKISSKYIWKSKLTIWVEVWGFSRKGNRKCRIQIRSQVCWINFYRVGMRAEITSNLSWRRFVMSSWPHRYKQCLMAWCKTTVTPLQTHWSYCSFAQSHRYMVHTSRTEHNRRHFTFPWMKFNYFAIQVHTWPTNEIEIEL